MVNINLKAAVIVCSDRAYTGKYEDKSTPAILNWCKNNNIEASYIQLIPDDIFSLQKQVLNYIPNVDFVIVCGGTGLGPTDITPQAIQQISDYEIAGIGELIRYQSLKYTPNAYLSRCGGWVKNQKLILALSGSPNAVIEQLEIIKDIIPNAIHALKGECKHPRHESENK